MNTDLSSRWSCVKRIEQQISDNLNDFTAKAFDNPLGLNALSNIYPLPLSLQAIEIQNLSEQFFQLEFGRMIVIAVKLEHLGRNASETFYLVIQCGNVSLRLGAGLQGSQQVYQVGNCAQGIVDFMGHGRGQSRSCSQLRAVQQGPFHPLA